MDVTISQSLEEFRKSGVPGASIIVQDESHEVLSSMGTADKDREIFMTPEHLISSEPKQMKLKNSIVDKLVAAP